jgi:hypothetical protein
MRAKFLTLVLLLTTGVGAVFAQAIFPVQNEKGKYGYVDASGNKIVDYKFDEATDVDKDGIARVMQKDKWGLINERGEIILNTGYTDIGKFVNGMARVSKGNKFGYINMQGEFVIPLKFSFIGTPNEDGLIWVATGKTLENAKYGLYKWDKLLVKPENDRLGVFAMAGNTDLTDGSCYKLTIRNQITSNFSQLPKNKSNYYWVVKKGKTGLVNEDGVYALKPGNYFVAMPTEDIVSMARILNGTFYYNYVFLDGNERRMFSSDVRDKDTEDQIKRPFLAQFHNGIAYNRINGEYYFIDTTGEKVSDTFSKLYILEDKGFLVKRRRYWGTLDPYGKYLIEPSYADIRDRHSKEYILAAQKDEDGKYGFIDYTGKEIIPFMYEDAYMFTGGRAYVKTNNGWGVVSKENKQLIAPKWENILTAPNADDYLLWVVDSKDSKWHCRNLTNDTSAFNDSYDSVLSFSNYNDRYVSFVTLDKKYGVVDEHGEVIIPVTFDDKEAATNAMDYLQFIGKDKMGKFEAFRYKLRSEPKCNSTMLDDKVDEDLWDF